MSKEVYNIRDIMSGKKPIMDEFINQVITELSSKNTSISDRMSYDDFCTFVEISKEQMSDYREELVSEMKKLGASESNFKLVTDELIRISIYNGDSPCDVAWALVQ